MMRLVAAFFVAAFLFSAIFGCAYQDEVLFYEFQPNAFAATPKAAPLDAEEYRLRYGYSRLDEDERAVYCAIKDAVFSFGSMSADICDYDTFKKVFVVFCADFPECFWVSGDWSVSGYVSGGVKKYTSYTPNFRYTKDEAEIIKALIDAAVEEFLAGVPADASDYDKAILAYKFVASYASYDNEAAEKLGEGKVDGTTDRSCLIDGFFIDRRAVCSGFSKALQHILHRLGIECAYVTGKSEGVGHSWNFVKLEGEYYFIDVTWAATRSEGTGHITYDFFCLTTEELEYDHEIESVIDFPECTATKMNYYVRSGLVAGSCDEGELAELFARSLELEGGGALAVKFASRELFDNACKILFDGCRIFEVLKRIDGIGYRSIKYSFDPGRFTVTVYLHENG